MNLFKVFGNYSVDYLSWQYRFSKFIYKSVNKSFCKPIFIIARVCLNNRAITEGYSIHCDWDVKTKRFNYIPTYTMALVSIYTSSRSICDYDCYVMSLQ